MPKEELDQKNSNKPLSIAIAGSLPPPIGGVTIHVKRLIEHLEEENISYQFYGKTVRNLLSLIFKKNSHSLVHIHHSNAFVRWFILKLLKTQNKKSIITIHRNLERETGIKRYFTNDAIQLSTVPIVLNKDSFTKASKLNSNTKLISPFLAPQKTVGSVGAELRLNKKNGEIIFCTNAYDLAYDNSKNEIYQISELVNIFSQLENSYRLIISDPTGNNDKAIKSKREIPENILFIPKPHKFIDIILQSDCLIRATTTDGDSISIKEALYFGINVIASDCVDRPKSCTLFETHNSEDLMNKIRNFKTFEVEKPTNAFPELLQLYKTTSQLS